MNITTLLRQRLLNQQIAATRFSSPEKLVHWMAAMQAQDYGQALMTIGARLPEVKIKDVEKTISDRKIIRTWLFRGTLHFVSASNVRPFLSLIGPKQMKGSAGQHRRHELDVDTLKKSKRIFSNILKDGKELTREEIGAALEQKKINASGLRLLLMLHHAALDKFICLGARRGKQFTYTLLDDHVPAGKPVDREEALASLALQYYQSHGPATTQDFAWWSALNLTEAKQGVELIKKSLTEEKIAGQSFWWVENNLEAKANQKGIYLLPGFDEYILGYKERAHFLEAPHTKKVVSSNGLFAPTIIINGQVAGIWKRTTKKDELLIETTPFRKLTAAENKAVQQAANKYGAFTGLHTVIKT